MDGLSLREAKPNSVARERRDRGNSPPCPPAICQVRNRRRIRRGGSKHNANPVAALVEDEACMNCIAVSGAHDSSNRLAEHPSHPNNLKRSPGISMREAPS